MVDALVAVDCSVPAHEEGHVTVRALDADEKRQQVNDARAGDPGLPRRRAQRDALLAASDWTQTAPDAPLTDEQRKEWAAYRQHLRDHPGGPFPDPPA